MLRLRNLMLALVMAALAPAAADASLIFTLGPYGPSTVGLVYSGFVTTSDLSVDSTPSNTANFISPSQGRIRAAGALTQYAINSPTGSQTFGTLGQANATGMTGSAVRINFADPEFLGLPTGYVSDSTIAGSMSFNGTLASLGLAPGTYTFNWGGGGPGRTVTLNVISTPVPEPATMAVMAIGSIIGGFGYRRRLKKANPVSAAV